MSPITVCNGLRRPILGAETSTTDGEDRARPTDQFVLDRRFVWITFRKRTSTNGSALFLFVASDNYANNFYVRTFFR